MNRDLHRVWLRRTPSRYGPRTERDAGDLLDACGFAVRDRRVLIKPNLVTAASSASGITADIALCRALLDRIEDCEVTIANDTWAGLERNGYVALARERGCRVVAVDRLPREQTVRAPVPRPVVFPRIPLPRLAIETDLRVSIAKMKIHSLAQVSLSAKNFFGLVPYRHNRVRIHPSIQKSLVDIVEIIPPGFAIVDGVIGNGRLEIASHPVPHGVLLAGWETAAVDIVGARCMRVPPESVEHLRRIAERRGVDMNRVTVDGPSPDEVAKEYPRGSAVLRYAQQAASCVSTPLARRAYGRARTPGAAEE